MMMSLMTSVFFWQVGICLASFSLFLVVWGSGGDCGFGRRGQAWVGRFQAHVKSTKLGCLFLYFFWVWVILGLNRKLLHFVFETGNPGVCVVCGQRLSPKMHGQKGWPSHMSLGWLLAEGGIPDPTSA